jgi:hypothetical protein
MRNKSYNDIYGSEEFVRDITRQLGLLSWFSARANEAAKKWLLDEGYCLTAVNLGHAISPEFPRIASRRSSHETQTIFNVLFEGHGSGSHSACYCSCLLDHCRPLDRFFRAAFTKSKDWSRNLLKNKILSCVCILESLLSTSVSIWLALIPSIIRVVVFEWLHLQHTCCNLYLFLARFHYRDPSEAQELRQEHAESIEQLEALLSEVMEDYWASGMDILPYLEGPLALRLDQILEAEYESDEEYTSSVFRATGVRLEREIQENGDAE